MEDPYEKSWDMTDGEHKELQIHEIMYLERLEKRLNIALALAGTSVLLGAIQTVLLFATF